MPFVESRLHAVPAFRNEDEATSSQPDDVGLAAMVFAFALLPIACHVAGLGRWGGGTLGLATLGVLFSGRELWTWLLASCRSSGGP